MKNFSSIGMVLALLCAISTPAFALGSTQTVSPDSGFIDQEKPNWIEAKPIPEKLFPTLAEAIEAANLIRHEASILHISSPTYEQAHRLLLQHLLMMQRQLHFNDETLAKFQSRSHPPRFTVDARIYEQDRRGIRAPMPGTIVQTGISEPSYYTYSVKPSRRTIIKQSENQNAIRVSLK